VADEWILPTVIAVSSTGTGSGKNPRAESMGNAILRVTFVVDPETAACKLNDRDTALRFIVSE